MPRAHEVRGHIRHQAPDCARLTDMVDSQLAPGAIPGMRTMRALCPRSGRNEVGNSIGSLNNNEQVQTPILTM